MVGKAQSQDCDDIESTVRFFASFGTQTYQHARYDLGGSMGEVGEQ